MRKVILGLVLMIVVSSNGTVNATETGIFNDVSENHWAKDSIGKLVGLDIVNGYKDGTFRPDENINVDSFIKLVVTGLGYTEIKNEEDYWATNYIDKALELNIIEDGQFDTYNRIISREEMASITVKALERAEKKGDVQQDYTFIKNCINDFQNIDDRYLQDVVENYHYGIMTGKSNGFDPKGTATRAEAVTAIVRLLDKSYRKPIFIPPTVAESDIQKDEKGIYYDFYKYVNYNKNDVNRYKGRIYNDPQGESTTINLLYAMDKVYKDNTGYVDAGRAGTNKILTGVAYNCIDSIDRTCDGTTTPIVSIITHTEVAFSIRTSSEEYIRPYNIDLFYKTHNMTYMECFEKYEKMFDTMLYYLYEDKYYIMKERVIEILQFAENMDADRYRYIIKMNDREMFVEMDCNHSVAFGITTKGGKIKHCYPFKESKPDFEKKFK